MTDWETIERGVPFRAHQPISHPGDFAALGVGERAFGPVRHSLVHRSTHMKTQALACACLLPLGSALLAAPLTESTFTQVINSVSVITPGSQEAQPAKVKDIIRAPQLVRTGPNSRAELIASDQTLTRVGANTIFSFEPKGRHINLQQGSVLFHSPTGRGGGTIKTGGAAAAVLGTTLVIVANRDGGFKGIVLEGKGKFTLPNGNSREVKAGQELFVLGHSKGFGPLLNIHLGKLVGGSGLVQGYSAPLPSLSKVQGAVAKQAAAIKKGSLQETGALVGDSATEDSVAVVDAATFEAAIKENESQLDKAWDKKITVKEEQFPANHLFSRSHSDYPRKSLWADRVTFGVLAEDIRLDSETLFLPTVPTPADPTQAPIFGIIAKDTLSLEDDAHFYAWGVAEEDRPGLALGGEDLKIKKNKDVRYDSPNGLFLGAENPIALKGSKIENRAGDLYLASSEGSINQDGGTLVAGVGKTLTIQATGKNEKVELGSVSLAGGNLKIQAEDAIKLAGVNFTRSGYNANFSGISMQAKTLIFSDIHLPFVPITLRTEVAELAPNPNTSAKIVTGRPNFYRGVTVQGLPAQLFVKNYDGARPDANITLQPLK